MYEDKMKVLPSGIYKSYLLDKIFRTYKLLNPVLEIGCGTGEFYERLKLNGLRGVSIDINSDTIEHCRGKCQHLGLEMRVYEKNIFDFETENSFNTIFMFEVLEHIENDTDALNKINRMLENNGYFLMSVPAKQSLFSAEDIFQGHLRRYEKKELLSKLTKAGFNIELFWTYNPFPYFTKYLLENNKEGSELDVETRTKNSSHTYFPTTKKLVDIFYPIYSKVQFLLKFQNFFLNTDFGAHYLVLAKKSD